MHADLVPIVDSFRPDLIVHDIAEFAAAPIATARNIAHVTVAFSGLLSELLLQGVVDSVAGVWNAEGLAVPSKVGLFDHLYLHRFPLAFGPPPPSENIRLVRPVGFDGSITDQAPAWIATLGVERPAVYATLGTVFSNATQWRDLVAALGSLDIDAVATVGSQFDPNELGEIPVNVRIERYVPQSFILERATVLISHAGAGSMLAGASRGLPQLFVPMGADQWENADALTATGAGITLEEDQRDAAAISDALRRLLDDKSFTPAATQIASEIAGLPHPDEYVRTFESLAGY
jgi:UDP:flavonoid glycosyltransferase YjiC (YdhE family)